MKQTKTILDHEKYMAVALAQAQRAFAREEVPIGAVVVDETGAIIARAYNTMEHSGCQTGHAEVRAIEKACAKRGNWRLDDCWIYVTLEPCVMCFGLIALSRLKGIGYGAKSPLFGVGIEDIEKIAAYRENVIIVGGLKEKESVDILRLFFKKARQKTGLEKKSEAKKRIL